jgi:DNA replication protein DnaC
VDGRGQQYNGLGNTHHEGKCRRCQSTLEDGRQFVCRVCDAEAEEYQVRIAERTEEHRLKVRDQCTLEKLERTGLSRQFYEGHKGMHTFDAASPAERRGLELARAWAKGEILGVFIHGDAGTGKSHLAESAVAELVGRGHAAIFRTARTLMLEIRSAFAPDAATSELAILQPYLRAQYLVIDDIGQGRITAFVADALFTLIDHRNRLHLPTLVTSNYSPRQLAIHLAEGRECSDLDATRIVDRLMELCPEVVHIAGESRRLKTKRRKAA